MNAKNTKIKFLKDKKVKFSLEFDSKIRYIYGAGVYIFYSPSKNSAYIGKSINIYDRLINHIRSTFLEYVVNDSNSYKALGLDDVEMYCCFTEDIYNYDEVEDISKELSILESYVIDVFLNSGIHLFNRTIVDYDINELESSSFKSLNSSIDLKYDFFSLGLKDRLIERYCYSDISHKLEIAHLNKNIEYHSKLSNVIKEENYNLGKEVASLKKQIAVYQSLMEQNVDVKQDNENKYKELYIKQNNLIKNNNSRIKDKLLEMNKVFCIYSSDDMTEFIKALKSVGGFGRIVASRNIIDDYIKSRESVDATFIFAISRLARKRSELALIYFFQYRVALDEEIKENILKSFIDAVVSEHKEFLHTFKVN